MKPRRIFNGWWIVEKIGKSSLGEVYEIIKSDDKGADHSALEVISIPPSEDEYYTYKERYHDDETVKNILKDQVDRTVGELIRTSRFANNPNIVKCEDILVVSNEENKGWDVLIRTELLTPLSRFCEQYTFTAEDAVKLGCDICRALELYEKEGIIHRNINPKSIFVSRSGDFKLGDLGIAGVLKNLVNIQESVRCYMAPEMYRGEPYNASVDTYSLGLVLYWLLNERKLPFAPAQINSEYQLDEVQLRRLRGETFPPSKNGGAELDGIILKACAFQAKDRYSSASEMYNDLWYVRTKAENDALADTVVCPWCGGGRYENILNWDQYEYSRGKCTQCLGTGYCSSGYLVEFQKLSITPKHRSADPACQACHGVGWMHMQNGSLYPCPFCNAKRSADPKPEKKKRFFCFECGTPVEMENIRCEVCQKKAQNKKVCSWCDGRGYESLVRHSGFRKYWFTTEPCSVCDGKKKLDEQTDRIVRQQINQFNDSHSHRRPKQFCSCCYGKGGVHVMDKPGISMCPRCAGKSTEGFSTLDEFRQRKRMLNRLSITCVFTWVCWSLVGACVYSGISFASAADKVIAIVLFMLGLLPIWIAVVKLKKKNLNGWKKASITRICVLLLLVLMTSVLIGDDMRQTTKITPPPVIFSDTIGSEDLDSTEPYNPFAD